MRAFRDLTAVPDVPVVPPMEAPQPTAPTLSRRTLLRVGATGALSLGAGALAAACGSQSAKSTSSTTIHPKRGGTLKAGLTGGGSSDTLDADNGLIDIDFARVIQLYDPLVNISLSGGLALQLAESVEPNGSATEWTIRLRPEVTFHNGKSLTAQDVIFTFRANSRPEEPSRCRLVARLSGHRERPNSRRSHGSPSLPRPLLDASSESCRLRRLRRPGGL